MEENKECVEISDEDIEAAFKEIKTYIDISLEDFKEIYLVALKHAESRLHNISVDNIMTKNPITMNKEANIDEAIHLFSEKKISCLPVTTNENKIIGIVTRKDIFTATGIANDHTLRDIIRHMMGVPTPHHHTVNDKTVGDIMSTPVITISSGCSVKAAANKLIEMRINNLPVVDKDNKLLGIVSSGDIVNHTGGENI